ncbi:hypothetical protein C8Q78DRAFT_1025554 [Trametes maxima]|nr:hypothetical protein C8Q78DRAFT_1025554 [Trametes maxima]
MECPSPRRARSASASPLERAAGIYPDLLVTWNHRQRSRDMSSCANAQYPKRPVLFLGGNSTHKIRGRRRRMTGHERALQASKYIIPPHFSSLLPLMSSQAGTSQQTNQGQESDDDVYSQPRTPRRTPMACQFCRGRKLKCDGRQTCANCQRRGLACTYMPIQK